MPWPRQILETLLCKGHGCFSFAHSNFIFWSWLSFCLPFVYVDPIYILRFLTVLSQKLNPVFYLFCCIFHIFNLIVLSFFLFWYVYVIPGLPVFHFFFTTSFFLYLHQMLDSADWEQTTYFIILHHGLPSWISFKSFPLFSIVSFSRSHVTVFVSNKYSQLLVEVCKNRSPICISGYLFVFAFGMQITRSFSYFSSKFSYSTIFPSTWTGKIYHKFK